MDGKKVLIRSLALKQYFPVGKNRFCKANDGITIDICEGETFGLVGESGCGKSTFGRTLLQLNRQTSGKTLYYGQTLWEAAPKYVGNTLIKYRRYLDAYRKFQSEVKKTESDWQAETDEAKKLDKLDKLHRQQAELEGKYYDLVSIVGGFITVEDNASALKLMLEEYKICREIRAMLEKIGAAKARCMDADFEIKDAAAGGRTPSAAQKVQADRAKARYELLMEKRAALEKKLQRKQEELRAFKEPYMKEEAFRTAEERRTQGIDLARLEYNEMRLLRSDLQMIFQDPYSSLNPRMTVGNIIGAGMKTHHLFIKENKRMQNEVLDVMRRCGLESYFLHRFPHQFSGGQRQRIGIARSLAVRPKFVVCDEAVSALDVSIQSQIINLLQDLKEQQNLTYLFITHDLSVVRYVSDRIGVMYLGNMVELAPAQEIFDRPMHPYTQALIAAIPTVDSRDGELKIIEGDIPSPVNPPVGCKFHTRCDYCTEICRHVMPEWEEISSGHFAACHHMHEISG